MRALFTLGFLLLVGVEPAFAQQYRVAFTASTDHDAIVDGQPKLTRYDMLVTPPNGGDTVTTTVDLGKPLPNATTHEILVDVTTALSGLPTSPDCNPASPSPSQCYTARVAAVGSGGAAPSLVSPPFHIGPVQEPPPPADTSPPTASLSVIASGRSGNFTAAVTASDASGILQVEFALDGQMIAVLMASPYTTTINLKDRAVHRLDVRVIDRAGNATMISRSLQR